MFCRKAMGAPSMRSSLTTTVNDHNKRALSVWVKLLNYCASKRSNLKSFGSGFIVSRNLGKLPLGKKKEQTKYKDSHTFQPF